jgi:hypothetical protein
MGLFSETAEEMAMKTYDDGYKEGYKEGLSEGSKGEKKNYMNITVDLSKETLNRLVKICDEEDIGIIEYVEKLIEKAIKPVEAVCSCGHCSCEENEQEEQEPDVEDIPEYTNVTYHKDVVKGFDLTGEEAKPVMHVIYDIEVGKRKLKIHPYAIHEEDMSDEYLPKWVSAQYWVTGSNDKTCNVHFDINPDDARLIHNERVLTVLEEIAIDIARLYLKDVPLMKPISYISSKLVIYAIHAQ